jgi:predicted dehydrogenase
MAHDKIVQVVLVGCGAVSQLYYTPALKELERLKLLRVKALFDPGSENLAKVHKAFPAAVAVKNLNELSRPEIDLAIIASPPRCHSAQTIQLLQAGLSVLCEKPMASSVAEGEAMIEAASAAEGLLAIGLFRRFFPATRTICEILS